VPGDAGRARAGPGDRRAEDEAAALGGPRPAAFDEAPGEAEADAVGDAYLRTAAGPCTKDDL
jgi:hypothetical protein